LKGGVMGLTQQDFNLVKGISDSVEKILKLLEGKMTLEPEEKPKEKCWCDMDKVLFWNYRKEGLMPYPNILKPNFCPVCGKPKKEWAK
jgi:hypothetical protein